MIAQCAVGYADIIEGGCGVGMPLTEQLSQNCQRFGFGTPERVDGRPALRRSSRQLREAAVSGCRSPNNSCRMASALA